MLNRGDIVRSSYFPELVEIKKCELIEAYYVLEAVGQDTKRFYELLLEKEKINDFQKIRYNIQQSNMKANDIQKYIQYRMLKNEMTYSHARAVGNKNVIPLPHQIEAVYGRMLQIPQTRFLLADDPGAGKTIMAGMLIKELMARYQSERVLILVPPLALKQWQDELEQKFGLNFHIINRNVLNEYGRKNPFIENKLNLTSMYWAVRDNVKPLIQEADYDLIIVDEAHKMAAYTQGTAKKKVFRTKLYQLGESILRKPEHVLLLTATPHKGDTENFRHLMKLIDEDVFNSAGVNESIRERANPFIIRRLKENLKNFDGTSIFPKRTTKTIQFELTESELDLYDNVTNYVREYFNKAIQHGSQSTAFAMMLLQRRLSSSIEAIYLSLKRRQARLVKLYKQTEEARRKYLRKIKRIDSEQYLEESNEQQEKTEKLLEQSIAVIDIKELKREILALRGLIKQAERIKLYDMERKYEELEETLFGIDGILQHDEKIIIFTESVDTLHSLEEKLLKRVPQVAKITGGLSMDKRRQQVELFRNDCQIMLATDAGGESINLQFCNQMINYDIPWNPNKLEQRMGRIHRIGQKNEVYVFNLVAKNTREGSVMTRLLDKMEHMRSDLGSDLVYDFIGEVLEDNFDSLSELMQKAIMERESLDDIIESMDKTLSNEHQKLIELVREEKMVEDVIDIPALKKKKDSWIVSRIPLRAYTDLTIYILEKKRVRIAKSKNERVFRIERLPKFIRDQMKADEQPVDEQYRFTNSVESITEDIPFFDDNHPLFRAGLALMKQEVEGVSWPLYQITSNLPEKLNIEIYEISIIDGTGKTLESHIIHLAERGSGEIITLDSNWVFNHQFLNYDMSDNRAPQNQLEIIKKAAALRDNVLSSRERQLNKLHTFLEQSFNQQYRETLKKLDQYQQENIENRNSALINQMNAKLMDLDLKKESRLEEINRQKNISLQPPHHIISLEVIPTGISKRVLASDFYNMVVNYERSNGRMNVKQYDNLGLVDFSSERFNGEPRFIILTTESSFNAEDAEIENLNDILDMVYIYVVNDSKVVEERKLI